MKYCKYCGKQIDDDAAFCSGCGKLLSVAQAEAKKAEKSKAQPDVVIVPGSCPNCGSTSYQTTRTHDSQIKRPRICNNCSNSYRTVEDIEKDIDYCKGALFPIITCGFVGIVLFFVLSSAFKIWDTFDHWDWASDNQKAVTIGFIIIAVAVFSAVIPSLTKRCKEIDELTEERDHLEAKNRALDTRNAATIPSYESIYKSSDNCVAKNSSKASVRYITLLPTERDFERLIKGLELREFIIGNGGDYTAYNTFYLTIHDKFMEMIEADEENNSCYFVCREDIIEVDIKLTYENWVLSCEMNCKR